MSAVHAAVVATVSSVSESQLRYGVRGAGVEVRGCVRCFGRGEERRWRGIQGLDLRAPWPVRASGRASAVAMRHWDVQVTTNWRDVDIAELRALLTETAQNCDLFPKVNPDGTMAEVSPVKLRRALQHSFIVVAMYVRGEIQEDYFPDRPEETRLKRTLVAFGRASSDHALTASIHDLAVAPSLQGQGIGRRLVQRIVREICRYGISDISVMASRDVRPFFRSCGFGSDVLGSTAMMYTAAEDCSDAEESWTLNVAEPRTKEVVKNVSSA